jgi:transmembrane sensor
MKPFDRNAADHAAAEWVIRRDAGLTAAEQDEYFQWLAADPRHGEAVARQQQTWKEFGLLAQWKPEHSAEPNPDLLARHRPSVVRTVWFGALAAAACVALALTLWAPWRTTSPDSPPQVARTDSSGYERRVLEDGSAVELNRGARISVTYTAHERRVQLLQGEASFTVAKNPARPFIVRAAGVDVRAVGTVFNVRLGDRQVEVLVTEGKVQVNDAARGVSLLALDATAGVAPVLTAGQKVVVATRPVAPVPPVAVSSDETARLLAWQPQLLDFNSTPLAEVVTAFNRRNTVQLLIADPELRELPIVASFRTDNVDGFVRLLELTAGVRAERSGDTITLRRAR